MDGVDDVFGVREGCVTLKRMSQLGGGGEMCEKAEWKGSRTR